MFKLDKDDMLTCPFDKNHRMHRNRLQQHILKCKLNYPEIEFVECPFNKTHLISESEYPHHVLNCSDRVLITQYKNGAATEEPEEEIRTKQEKVDCDEDWDDTDVVDFDPKKHIQDRKVIRVATDMFPSKRKMFFENETKRLSQLEKNVNPNKRDAKRSRQSVETEAPTTSKRSSQTIAKIKTELDEIDSSEEEYNVRYPKPPTTSKRSSQTIAKIKTEVDERDSSEEEYNVRYTIPPTRSKRSYQTIAKTEVDFHHDSSEEEYNVKYENPPTPPPPIIKNWNWHKK